MYAPPWDYAAFLRAAKKRLDECRLFWTSFGTAHGLRLSGTGPGDIPILSGLVDTTEVEIRTLGNAELGFHTRVAARARLKLEGTLVVRHATEFEAAVGTILHRHAINDDYLDSVLKVKTSSKDLAKVILDEKTVAVLRSLVSRPLHELSFGNDLVCVEWIGIEREPPIFEAVFDLVTNLASKAPEPMTNPYR